MKPQIQMTAKIKRAAQSEAEAWHDLCRMTYIYGADNNYLHELLRKWELTREHLADTMNLHGNDRYRTRLFFEALMRQM